MIDIQRLNRLSKSDFAEVLTNSYFATGNTAQFIYDWTNLFKENDGTINTPYEKQIEFMNCINPLDRIICALKCRQSGISTAAVAKVVYWGYFGIFPDIVVISSTKVQAMKIMRRIKQCFEDMPEIMRPVFKVEQAQELVLANNSRIVCLSSNPFAAKGWTGGIILDEFASHTARESRELYEAVYPSTTKGGHIIVVSTPFGNDGMFYDLSTKTLAEISGNKNTKFDIKRFFIRWEDVPYIVNAVENEGLFDGLSEEQRKQEYELEFILANIEEQYFTRDFVLSTLREKEEDIPLYTSYGDLGIPIKDYIGDNCENTEVPLDPKYIIAEQLRAKYTDIRGGWDIASTENDSVLKVSGELREKPGFRHCIGDFLVNRVHPKMHDTIYQANYIKRIMMSMGLDVLNGDAVGLGGGALDYLKKDPILGNKVNVFKMQTEEKYQEFQAYKNELSEGRYKRRWEENNYTRECTTQYTNLRLNQLNLSLKAKGVKKDDHPFADMLARCKKSPVRSNIYIY